MGEVKMAKVVIDEVEVEVPEGTLIIEAARRAGIAIPHFCYHPRLEPVGMCRQCLVEIEGARRLVASCTQRVRDGMRVKVYTSQDAVEGRKAVLEFLLINHPLDCPVCDKGGECPLQNQYYFFSSALSRFAERKRRWPKPVPISENVLLDMERCVLCRRCVRFCDEVAGEPVLEFMNRGWYTQVAPFFGETFASRFSGNTIDLCPVGALTSRSFRFKARVWELTNFPSICPYCACGCNILVGQRVNDIKRVTPGVNEAVNEAWLCDKGRFDYSYTRHGGRLQAPMLRRNGVWEEVSWGEALDFVAQRLKAIVEEHGPGSVAALGSPWCTNEENYLLQRIFRGILGTNNVTTKHDAWRSNGFGSLTFEALERADVFLFFGADVIEELPIAWLRVYKALRRRGARLLLLHPRRLSVERHAALTLTYPEGQELRWAQGLALAVLEAKGPNPEAERLRAILQEASEEAERVREMAEALAQGERVILFAGKEVLHNSEAPHILAMLRTLLDLLGKGEDKDSGLVEFLPYANSRGTLDMGLWPDLLPGRRPLEEAERAAVAKVWGVDFLPAEPGLSFAQLQEAGRAGRLKALYVMGADPLRRLGGEGSSARPGWAASLELLVVQELAFTETARWADVLLPAACFAEKKGTFTNAEGRVQRLHPGILPPGEALADNEILARLGQRLREVFGRGPRHWPLDAEEVMAEIRCLVPEYAKAAEEERSMP